MNKTYTFCCKRCGNIFESAGDPDFCEDCRKIVYHPAKKKTCVTRKLCNVCGRSFVTTAAKRIICPECRSRTAAESEYTINRPVKKPKKRTMPDIVTAVRQAQSEGLSYGEYIAKYGDRS